MCVPTLAGALTHRPALLAGPRVPGVDLDLDAVPGTGLQVRQGHSVVQLAAQVSGLQGAPEDICGVLIGAPPAVVSVISG